LIGLSLLCAPNDTTIGGIPIDRIYELVQELVSAVQDFGKIKWTAPVVWAVVKTVTSVGVTMEVMAAEVVVENEATEDTVVGSLRR
jgi:hypothetical protein